jgi:transcriptional regulator with XRE-family HTH domain
MKNLPDRLRAVRKAKGLSQGELADLIGVSTSYISAVESGRFTPEGTLLNIAIKLGVDKDWLINGEGEKPEWVKELNAKRSKNEVSDPYRDFAIARLTQENERLWLLVQKLTGASVAEVAVPGIGNNSSKAEG